MDKFKSGDTVRIVKSSDREADIRRENERIHEGGQIQNRARGRVIYFY